MVVPIPTVDAEQCLYPISYSPSLFSSADALRKGSEKGGVFGSALVKDELGPMHEAEINEVQGKELIL